MKKQKQAGGGEAISDSAPRLAELALDLRDLDLYAKVPEELKGKRGELRKTINKCLQQGRETTLHEALDLAAEEDEIAWQVLRAQIEELSENLVLRRDEGTDLEVNAFVIPMFVRSVGGLQEEQCFQDTGAFEQLRESLREAGLESRKANVVLVAHAYHLDEIDRIGYTQLAKMVHEAHEAMTRRKTVAAQAIGESMSGWPASPFGPEDEAVELRFLLGFAMKSLDDPFYVVPEKEAAAERYFDARAQRFRDWTQQIVPVLTRCLVTDGREIDIDFLYQDLFYGGTAAARAEYRMLQMMSGLQQALQEQGVAPQDTSAVIGTTEADDGLVLRVQIYAQPDESLVASADKPMEPGSDFRSEAEDVRDALAMLGVQSLHLARRFDIDGKPVDVRPFVAR